MYTSKGPSDDLPRGEDDHGVEPALEGRLLLPPEAVEKQGRDDEEGDAADQREHTRHDQQVPD